MSRIVAADVRSNISRNCSNITEEFGIDPWMDMSKKIKREYKFYEVPETDRWRIPLLDFLLRERYELDAMGDDKSSIEELIALTPFNLPFLSELQYQCMF